MLCKVCGCPKVRWLQVPTIARHLSCTTRKVRRMINSGELSGIRLGRNWRVDHKSLHKLIQRFSVECAAEEDAAGQ